MNRNVLVLYFFFFLIDYEDKSILTIILVRVNDCFTISQLNDEARSIYSERDWKQLIIGPLARCRASEKEVTGRVQIWPCRLMAICL